MNFGLTFSTAEKVLIVTTSLDAAYRNKVNYACVESAINSEKRNASSVAFSESVTNAFKEMFGSD
jgi:hypothetical protein